MKSIKSIIAILFSITGILPVIAEAPQEVTLTVSSDGPTKEDAMKNALRSAIEQAYGAFVSANTTILNDELVKDEIVTISNGSIKNYTEISDVQTGNGSHFVTLSATVSLPNLVTYAKNHGSECEFAGNTFGMEMKLYELQKQNELKALYNLSDQIEALLPVTMKHELKVGEPRIPTSIYFPRSSTDYHTMDDVFHRGDLDICVRFNPRFVCETRLCNGKHYAGEIDIKAQDHVKTFLKDEELFKKSYYEVPMKIRWVCATNKSETEISKEVEGLIADYESTLDPAALKKFSSEPVRGRRTRRNFMVDSLKYALTRKYREGPIPGIIANTLKSISIPSNQVEEYEKRGIYPVELFAPSVKNEGLRLRNSLEDLEKWVTDLSIRIERKFNSFVIADNTGTISDFFPQHIADRCRFAHDNWKRSYDQPYGPNMINDYVPLMMDGWSGGSCIFGTGLFYNYVFVRYGIDPYPIIPRLYDNDKRLSLWRAGYITQEGPISGDSLSNDYCYKWELTVYIPKEDIGKYSKFWIETKK